MGFRSVAGRRIRRDRAALYAVSIPAAVDGFLETGVAGDQGLVPHRAALAGRPAVWPPGPTLAH